MKLSYIKKTVMIQKSVIKVGLVIFLLKQIVRYSDKIFHYILNFYNSYYLSIAINRINYGSA